MMKNNKTFVNIIGTLAIILAFSFSPNMSASSVSAVSTTNVTLATTYFTVVGGGGSWYNNRYKKCGHCGRRGCTKNHSTPKCGKCGGGSHGGSCGGGTGGGGSTPSVPLDGGLGFLMLGAAALGIKKLRAKKDAKS